MSFIDRFRFHRSTHRWERHIDVTWDGKLASQSRFLYKTGGGPALDIGPYYITQLVNLLGPVVRVAGLTTIGNAHRSVTSEPLKGSVITVDVPTTVNGLLEFEMGANISLSFLGMYGVTIVLPP